MKNVQKFQKKLIVKLKNERNSFREIGKIAKKIVVKKNYKKNHRQVWRYKKYKKLFLFLSSEKVK